MLLPLLLLLLLCRKDPMRITASSEKARCRRRGAPLGGTAAAAAPSCACRWASLALASSRAHANALRAAGSAAAKADAAGCAPCSTMSGLMAWSSGMLILACPAAPASLLHTDTIPRAVAGRGGGGVVRPPPRKPRLPGLNRPCCAEAPPTSASAEPALSCRPSLLPCLLWRPANRLLRPPLEVSAVSEPREPKRRCSVLGRSPLLLPSCSALPLKPPAAAAACASEGEVRCSSDHAPPKQPTALVGGEALAAPPRSVVAASEGAAATVLSRRFVHRITLRQGSPSTRQPTNQPCAAGQPHLSSCW
jgi:hypothetical protein